jgi:hypothetical protein
MKTNSLPSNSTSLHYLTKKNDCEIVQFRRAEARDYFSANISNLLRDARFMDAHLFLRFSSRTRSPLGGFVGVTGFIIVLG